jgi:pyruvate/2-oxoglutarate dehydrogenase complex dihydrolipoamide acyltransferase (E2) component
MRRIIAERMRAGSSVPTFTAEIEVAMTDCIQLRSELNEHSKDTAGSAITTLLRSAPPSLSRTIPS